MPSQGTKQGKVLFVIAQESKTADFEREINTFWSISFFISRVPSIFRRKMADPIVPAYKKKIFHGNRSKMEISTAGKMFIPASIFHLLVYLDEKMFCIIEKKIGVVFKSTTAYYLSIFYVKSRMSYLE